MANPVSSSDSGGAWPSPARAWALIVLMALASVVSQFDRTVINLTVGPLKQAFSLNDTQFAMLQSVAFGIFYTVACIPLGWLADRYQRRVIMAVSLAFFSLFAIGSGLARSYTQLFLTRVGVGRRRGHGHSGRAFDDERLLPAREARPRRGRVLHERAGRAGRGPDRRRLAVAVARDVDRARERASGRLRALAGRIRDHRRAGPLARAAVPAAARAGAPRPGRHGAVVGGRSDRDRPRTSPRAGADVRGFLHGHAGLVHVLRVDAVGLSAHVRLESRAGGPGLRAHRADVRHGGRILRRLDDGSTRAARASRCAAESGRVRLHRLRRVRRSRAIDAVAGARAGDARAGDLSVEHAVRVRRHVDPADRAEPRARAGHGAVHHADHARGARRRARRWSAS